MKVEKISDTSIEFILTPLELKEKKIDVDKLTSEDEYTQKIVANLIEEAEVKYNIFIKNNNRYKLYISSNNKGELNIIVSSFDIYEDKYKLYQQIAQQLTGIELQNDGLKNYSASSLEDKLLIKMGNNAIVPISQAPQKTQKFSIYCFNNISDIKFALEDLDTTFKNEILYKYKGKYYLIIFYSKNNIGKKKIETNFGEYAILISHGGFELILQEYGECLIKGDARNIINLYF